MGDIWNHPVSSENVFNTWPGLIFPGHQAIDGSLIPPSNVVSLPQRNGPLLPPKSENILVCENPEGLGIHYYQLHTFPEVSCKNI